VFSSLVSSAYVVNVHQYSGPSSISMLTLDEGDDTSTMPFLSLSPRDRTRDQPRAELSRKSLVRLRISTWAVSMAAW
jgi:hypothetical protein